jgi:hypothetical protein
MPLTAMNSLFPSAHRFRTLLTMKRSLSVGLGLGLVTFAIAACSSDESKPPSSTPSTPIDSGTPDVSSDAATDACAAGLPPSGITRVAQGAKVGINADIGVTENGAPVLAYQAPDGDKVGIFVVRWNYACSHWETPIKVETTAEYPGTTSRMVALAYDASNGSVGVAYQWLPHKIGEDGVEYQIHYATLAKGATAVSAPERVDDPTNQGLGGGVVEREAPGIAMANGKVYVAYVVDDTVNERTKDGGTWSAEVRATPARGRASSQSLEVRVDSAGNPGVAFLAVPAGGSDIFVDADFWRPGSPAVKAMGANVGTDDPNVALAFDGTKPRIAAAIHLTPTWATDAKLVWFAASDDGTTWADAVPIPEDTGSGFGAFTSVAVGSNGTVAVVSDENSGDGTQQFGMMKISKSTDLKTFTTTGVPKSYPGSARFVQSAYGPDGKLMAAFFEDADAETAGAITFYREP